MLIIEEINKGLTYGNANGHGIKQTCLTDIWGVKLLGIGVYWMYRVAYGNGDIK